MQNSGLYSVFMPAVVYPCWAYALERTTGIAFGNGIGFDLIRRLPELYQDYDPNSVQIGDIVVWMKPEEEITRDSFPIFITPEAHIVSRWVEYAAHAGVYEGKDMVSDMTVAEGCNELPFTIRLRLLSDMSRKPDKMIKRKRLLEGELLNGDLLQTSILRGA